MFFVLEWSSLSPQRSIELWLLLQILIRSFSDFDHISSWNNACIIHDIRNWYLTSVKDRATLDCRLEFQLIDPSRNIDILQLQERLSSSE